LYCVRRLYTMSAKVFLRDMRHFCERWPVVVTTSDGGARNGANGTTTAEDRVYRRIRAAIAKRYIGPGRQLVEETLAAQLGVSRTPVRSAIRRLEYEGLVEIIPRRGAFVVTPTRKEIEDAFAVRIHLERMSVRLAAAAATPSDAAALESLVAEEARIFDRRLVEEYYRANDAIHLKIAELGGNRALRDFVAQVLARTDVYLTLFDPFMTISLNPSMEEHLVIVRALRDHDADAAEQAIQAHLENTLANLELDSADRRLPEDYLRV